MSETTPPAKKTKAPKKKRRTAAKILKEIRDADVEVVDVYHRGKQGRVLLDLPSALAVELTEGDLPELWTQHPIQAVEAELDEIRRVSEKVADSALAAFALQMAREMSNPRNSATSKAYCAREARETITRLRELAPVKEEGDQLDELQQRRVTRLAALDGGAGSGGEADASASDDRPPT